MSRLRTLITGLTALTGLALIIVGIPFLLVALAGNPLPDSVPSLSSIGNALSRFGGDATILLGLLKYAAWAAWVWFTISAIAQIVAQAYQAIAGRPRRAGAAPTAPRVARVPRAVDSAVIGRMVAAVLALFTVLAVPSMSLAAPASATTTPGPDTAQAPVATAGPTAGAGHTHPGKADGKKDTKPQTKTTSVPRTVTIEKGDTLSEVSQEQYGTPSKWSTIFKANRGADQGNGQQLRDPDLIYPGLQVTIPGKSDTVTRAVPRTTYRAAKAPTRTSPTTITPTGKATTVTGKDTRAATPAAPRVAQPATGSDASTTNHHASTADAAPASPSAAPDPLSGRSPAGAGSAIAPTPQPQPAQPNTATDQAVATEADTTAVVRTVTGLGSIAAAGALALLGLRRRRQTRTRRPGQRINLPTGQAAITEAHLRATADPLTVRDVDLALRTMAHNAVTAGMPIPGLRAARITTTAIELYLTDPTSLLPAPFTAEDDDPGVWTLTRDTAAGQLLDETTAALTPAPYPTLVTIGHDEDDAHLLLNLEELRTLAITGETEHTHPVLAAIALELIASQWADAATITLVGVLPELADALGAGNVSYVEDLAQILASMEHTAHVNADEMRAAGVDTPQQARATGMDADTWTPHLIITAEPPTADQRELVRDILHTSPRTSIAAVTQGAPLGEWQLHVTAPDHAELAPQQIALTPQRLDPATLNQILEGFRAADQPHHEGPDWAETITGETSIEQVPDALPDHLNPDDAAAAAWQADLDEKRAIAIDPARRGPDTDELEAIIDPEHDLTHLVDTIPHPVTTLPAAGPTLRLLGPVRLDHPGGDEPQAPGRSLKILAHMALAPGGHHPELDQAVWPNISVDTKTRAPAITMARKWAGTAPDGHDYLARHTATRGYHLADDLSVDWRLFQQLVGPDISQASTQNLADALHLVYGIPLTNAQLGDDASIGYLSHENEIASAIADVAHELATRFIETGKPRAALWAASKGLDTNRGEETLWRDTLLAAHQLRDTDTTTQIINAYTTYTTSLGCDPDPDTEHLINQITNRHPAHA